MLRRHRVVSAGELRLSRRLPAVSEWADRYGLLRKLLVEAWSELDAGVDELGIGVAGIKGLATRPLECLAAARAAGSPTGFPDPVGMRRTADRAGPTGSASRRGGRETVRSRRVSSRSARPRFGPIDRSPGGCVPR